MFRHLEEKTILQQLPHTVTFAHYHRHLNQTPTLLPAPLRNNPAHRARRLEACVSHVSIVRTCQRPPLSWNGTNVTHKTEAVR
jgi:hypothetical protein